MTSDPLLKNLRLAIACGVEPTLALVVAITSAGVHSTNDLFDILAERRSELEAIMNAPSELQLDPLEPELEYEPELARMRLEQGDHEIRGRALFSELLRNKSFFQVAAFEIAGIELTPADAELLEQQGIVTQIADPRVWPLGITRRIAANGGDFSRAFVGGIAACMSAKLAVMPVAGFMRFLDRVEGELQIGVDFETALDAVLQSQERIPGVGRPTLKGDERVGPQLELMKEFGRDCGPSMVLARRVDSHVRERKALGVNSAGYQAALLRDLGFSPDAAAAFCMLYFAVPVLAHAVYPSEHALSKRG